jgi:hypothetical protein
MVPAENPGPPLLVAKFSRSEEPATNCKAIDQPTEVIDHDLGKSTSRTRARAGFEVLLASPCAGSGLFLVRGPMP